MSMLQLQETRVAQLLQTIRHQVGNPLQKRIRSVIKAWQKLLEPGSACATVIPLQRNINTSNNNGSTATKFSSSTPNITNSSPSTQSSNGRSKILRNQSSINHHNQEPPTKIPDRKKISSTTALPNGCSPKLPSSLNGRVSVITDVPKLAKVKSTAELVQEAGGCIDSVTKDRILSNRIAKESDEFPRLVPLAAMRSSRKAKHPPSTLPSTTHHHQKSVSRNADRILPPPPPPPPPPVTQPSPQCNLSIPPTKSEIIAKFLEHAPSQMESPRETRSISSDHNSRHHHHHKEKRKHGKRRRENKEEGDGEDALTEPKQPPVTNHMDDWPTLSPLTEEVMREAAATWLRDYHSGRTPSQTELGDVGRVADLLQGTWEEVSASRGDNGCLEPMTALYSVDMGDDQLVHILPWTNLGDYKQTFFPPGSTTASDLDRLIDLPEPW
ncbi:unnamed protein product [Hydatigera taeniaeformis]|uniref:Mediator of RNA polymerase II transcription subunit 26 n=1 Tax=Hydatigena taeniaeformis TaxID=6205 RepID=A0A0R3X6V4_HYDTA|nr:unnamed protein product [Hydatigera taeniaeformis]